MTKAENSINLNHERRGADRINGREDGLGFATDSLRLAPLVPGHLPWVVFVVWLQGRHHNSFLRFIIHHDHSLLVGR